MSHVAVLGAGVIGLQCAINLLDAGYKVTIVASDFPGDRSAEYTSPWAGAHWRTHASAEDTEQQAWDLETYEEWIKQIDAAKTLRDRATLGLKMYDSISHWDTEPTESLWWAPHVRSFNLITPPALPAPLSPAVSATFRSIAINAPAYLLHLRSLVLSRGGVFIRSRIPAAATLASSLSSVAATVTRITRAPPPAVYVVALGLGARRVAHDYAVHPVKGQTVLVRGEADAIRTALWDGGIAYVIPRPGSGTSILGGTKEVGVWDAEADDGVTAAILERASGLAPELLTGQDGGFEVVGVQVGLRPARRGGARMEREVLEGEEGAWRVVHAYGHSGAGYQNSIGVARRVVTMVRESEGSEGEEKAKL